ncbi:MAG TPA: DNA repair protein RecN [Candidatus Limisoma intestinavium]|uniref:DNA repair protein RecN n=1 Tax=Candidatus Limisoma intestinavium TaxID=2840856 RepID=A0A9D1IIX8_9BACT|nr:DNA repair protein RecN [Candidatus Limisoma intestinavium]
MLQQLSISNYALIDQLDISFGNGLSIITGETGAGKSIVIGALSLILGQRADTKVIRDESKKTVVEATFDVESYDLSGFFEENDIDFAPECIVRREIMPNGRTRAFVNDTPVTLSLLGELSQKLIDIHSQHSNALLLRSSYQLSVIDSLAGNKDLLARYKEVYNSLVQARRIYEQEKEKIEKDKQDEEYIRFQLNQLTEANLEIGEEETLEKKKRKIENLALLQNNLSETCRILNDGDRSVLEMLSDAEKLVAVLESVYENASEIRDRIESASIELKDIADTVRQELSEMDGDIGELEMIDERLSLIYMLQQKFKVHSVEELLALKQDMEQRVSAIDHSEEKLDDMMLQIEALEKNANALADSLSRARKSTAVSFMENLKEKARDLGLKNFNGAIAFERVDFSATGRDKIRFEVSFNVNRQLLPIEETASGGEMSRLMLCIKSLIATKMQLPTIIFDEIDTGVSGEIANKIGVMMKDISSSIQVVTITHLPQVAALGDRHYKVYKQDTEKETVTRMKELDAESRILEIAGMLSGSQVDSAAIENAKSLMKNY